MKSMLNLNLQRQMEFFRYPFFACLLTLLQICFISVSINGQERGAQMPYTRYESEDAQYGNGAELLETNYDQTLIASEASNRKCVQLTTEGSYIQWLISEEARGMVLRFSIPDSSSGGGINRSLSLYINNIHSMDMQLTSKFAWQYFDVNNNPSNNPSVGRPRMRFDEYRVVLPDTLYAGDTIKIQRDATDTALFYAIDFIELEPIPAEIPKPSGYLDVTAYGATPDDETNDYTAFYNCINAASSGQVGMYVPKGRYVISSTLTIKNNVTIQGAGIWYTNIYFSNSTIGGLNGNGTNIRISGLYLDCANTQRQTYRGLGGYWGVGSIVDSVWLTHFETGAWIANYSSASVTDSLLISNCRIRNTYADGCNFARGTKNSILENCSLRNNGDDAMATWSSDTTVVPECSGNIFRFNTVENTYRAGGLGIFGGRGHTAHHCIIRDNLYDGGIRITSIFPAHVFSDTDYINIYDMTLDRTGPTTEWSTVEGAINLEARYFDVRNIKFDSIDINGSGHHGIFIKSENGYSLTDIHFKNFHLNNAGNYGIYIGDGTLGWGAKSNVVITNPGLDSIYDHAPFILKEEGIEILTVSHTGMGSVILDPAGGSYTAGTEVTLTAIPDPGYQFNAWSGDLTDSVNPATIIMDDYKSVTANFSQASGVITIQDKKNSNIVCSPNPVTDQLMIWFNDNSCNSVSVYDFTGKEYLHTTIGSNAANCSVDFKNLPNGLYFLKFITNTGTQINKIIKN